MERYHDLQSYPVQRTLSVLLKDRSTGKNIIWATDPPGELAFKYTDRQPITVDQLQSTGFEAVQPRMMKESGAQQERTKKKGEVFTPAWICCLMNNQLDEIWFRRKRRLPCKVTGQSWENLQGPIFFQKGRKWQTYVDSRRLEICCGEAPFLVSRYDSATGESLPIERRIGILDRKLRVINENAADEKEWLKWAKRAVQSTYGYEYQGDNLLLARINVLLTFTEYYEARWERVPKDKDIEETAEIISWNLWQMDGLKKTVPYGKPYENEVQMSVLGMFWEEEETATPCIIRDWLSQRKHQFAKLREGTHPMKFDFIIGNPPYQDENSTSMSTSNGQKPMTNVFHRFQMGADDIVRNTSVLIYPAGRWLHRSGKGLTEFGLKQINDPTLVKVIIYADAKDVFPGVDIADGISIVIKDKRKKQSGFEYVYIKNGKQYSLHMENPGEELIPLNPKDKIITDKLSEFVKKYNVKYLSEAILPRTLFGIESDFVENHPGLLRPYEDGMEIDFNEEIKIFTNDKAGKAGRAKWFVGNKSIVSSNADKINEFQVVVSSANAGGQKRDNQLDIIDNHSAFGRARVALRSFKTLEEAKNFYDYVSSYIIRFAFLMTDEALSSLGKRVPDIIDYSNTNQLIDFNRNIDDQLQEKMHLEEDDMQYIHERVDGIRSK